MNKKLFLRLVWQHKGGRMVLVPIWLSAGMFTSVFLLHRFVRWFFKLLSNHMSSHHLHHHHSPDHKSHHHQSDHHPHSSDHHHRASEHHHYHASTHVHHKPTKLSFFGLLRLLLPPAFSKSAAKIYVYTTCLCTRVLLTMKLARLSGVLGAALQSAETTELLKHLVLFGLWSLPSTLSDCLISYLERVLTTQIRRNLQAHVHRGYFDDVSFTYYRMSQHSQPIQHVDQRLTQDIAMFSHDLVHVYGHFLKLTLDISVLIVALSKKLGPASVGSYILYFGLANVMLAQLKPIFASLGAKQQELEGQFRSAHSRIILHSEQIAFLRGTEHEKLVCDGMFSSLTSNQDWLDFVSFVSQWLDSYFLTCGGEMMAYAMMLPSLHSFNKQGGVKGRRGLSAEFLTASHLLLSLGANLKDIVIQNKVLARLQGLTSRISELLHTISSVQSAQPRGLVETTCTHLKTSAQSSAVCSGSGHTRIEVNHLDVAPLWGSELLIKDLSLKVGRGGHLLVEGANGSGKTSFFRVLAGLWNSSASASTSLPPLAEEALLRLPCTRCMSFTPQKSYFPPCSLLMQVLYPEVPYHLDLEQIDLCFVRSEVIVSTDDEGCEDCANHFATPAGTSSSEPPPKPSPKPSPSPASQLSAAPTSPSSVALQLQEALKVEVDLCRAMASLKLVGLECLVEKYGWHEPVIWQDTLSGGEAQRLAMARVYYRRPEFAVLDEATNAMSEDVVADIYRNCQNMGITIVTIAHDSRLQKFHHQRLRLSAGQHSSWSCSPCSEGQSKQNV